MKLPGKRLKHTRLIQTDRFVVAVEVEQVIPVDDPSEPCYEAETIDFLKDVHDHAIAGDVTWLKARGKVYQVVDAA